MQPQEICSLIRLPVVRARTGLSETTIWRLIRQGKFPTSINIGGRSIAWPSNEIDAWIADRIAQSRKAAA